MEEEAVGPPLEVNEMLYVFAVEDVDLVAGGEDSRTINIIFQKLLHRFTCIRTLLSQVVRPNDREEYDRILHLIQLLLLRHTLICQIYRFELLFWENVLIMFSHFENIIIVGPHDLSVVGVHLGPLV